MPKRPKKLDAPEWTSDWSLSGDDVVIWFTRTEKTVDGLFFRIEKKGFSVPKSIVRQLLLNAKE